MSEHSRTVTDQHLELPAPSGRLWAVILLLAITGTLLVAVAIYFVAQTFSIFGLGGFFSAIATFVLLVSLIPLLFGAGLFYLALRLKQGDKLARVLTVLTCSSIAVAAILSGSRDLGLGIIALMCVGVVLLLTADPVVRTHFSGPDARYAGEPVQIVSARALMVIVGVCVVIVGASFMVLAPWSGSLTIYGLIALAIGATVFWLSRKLAAGDASARLYTTALFVLYLIMAIIAGHGEPGVIIPVGLALGVVGLLWIPTASQQYFQELPRPTQPQLLAIEQGSEGLLASGRATEANGREPVVEETRSAD